MAESKLEQRVSRAVEPETRAPARDVREIFWLCGSLYGSLTSPSALAPSHDIGMRGKRTMYRRILPMGL